VCSVGVSYQFGSNWEGEPSSHTPFHLCNRSLLRVQILLHPFSPFPQAQYFLKLQWFPFVSTQYSLALRSLLIIFFHGYIPPTCTPFRYAPPRTAIGHPPDFGITEPAPLFPVNELPLPLTGFSSRYHSIFFPNLPGYLRVPMQPSSLLFFFF